MFNILYKEFRLTASKLTYFSILFGLMFFIPGYPILCGVFFTTLGIFRTFQNVVETNDIVFSVLLPITKKDVVKGKFLFSSIIELLSMILMTISVIIRSTILVNFSVYRNNAMMNANLFALAMAFIIFGLFNLIFISGFFKTTYKRTKPFMLYAIVSFIAIAIGETLHHIPALAYLNAFGSDYLVMQLLFLFIGIIIFLLLTYIAYRKSCDRFERIDI